MKVANFQQQEEKQLSVTWSEWASEMDEEKVKSEVQIYSLMGN